MLVLDTDHMSILEWTQKEEALRLRARLATMEEGDVATTIISYEEQMRGWLSYSAQAAKVDEQVAAYRKLRQHVDNYRRIKIVDFDYNAAIVFQRLRKQHRRISQMDLKIAAIALSQDAVLLTRNRRDFGQIDTLTIADWTQE